jgi:hypothetical protein
LDCFVKQKTHIAYWGADGYEAIKKKATAMMKIITT